MAFSFRTRYLLVTLAIITASIIQLVRGYRPLIVIIGAVAFLFVGNLTVWLSASKERAIRKRRHYDYWAN